MNKKKSVRLEIRFLEKLLLRVPEDIEILQALAELYTTSRRYEEGLKADQKLSQLSPADGLVWYNLGCSYALTNHLDQAFEALTKSIDLGYEDYDWMKSDPDLANLRDDPRFESLLSWLYSVFYEEDR
jgi:tetratricopeptide (TPR) repeat protein